MTFSTSRNDLEGFAAGHGPDDRARESAWDPSLFWQGRCVLVVENDFMVADDLSRELGDQGARVMGPAGSVTEALDLLQTGALPDAAILDVELEDEAVYPVADALRGRNIPFVFATLQPAWSIPHTYADVPCVENPVNLRRLAKVLARRSAGLRGNLE